MCELFDKNKRTISEHIRNIFSEGELQEKSVVRKFRTTAIDGKNYDVKYYNLDVIISVGYRVKSSQELKKFKEEQKKVSHEQSLKEIEEDIKRLKKDTNT